MTRRSRIEKFHVALLVMFFAFLIWSVIDPKDLFTWFLEVMPALIGIVIIFFTYNRFRLTNLVYFLKFINAYKSASSRLIKRDFPHIRKKLWKEMFWSKSFCLLTTGGAPIDALKKYIENQGQK